MTRSSVRRFTSMLTSAAPRQMATSVLLMVLLAATEGVGILLMLPLLALAGVTTGGPMASGLWASVSRFLPDSLGMLLILYVVVVSARAALEWAESVASIQVNVEVTRSLRERIYRALVRARWETVVPLRGTRLAHVLTTELDRVSQSTSQLLYGLLQLCVAAIYAATAVMVSPQLAIVAAAGALALLLPARRQHRAARRDGDAITALGGEVFAGATEEVATLKVAKSAGIAERVAERFSDRSEAFARAVVVAHRRYRAAGAFLSVGAATALAVVVYVAVVRLHLAAASLLLLLLVCARLVPRLTSVQNSYLFTVRSLPAAEAVLDLLDALESASEPVAGGRAVPVALSRSLDLENVSYRYPGAGRDALRGVSATIPAGQVTAIVGPSGSGKSTLADLVLLLLTPSQGRLLVDDVPLTEAARDAWRATIGYVPQETHLFHDTVRENVRWVSPESSDVEVMEALRLAGATELVARLPNGLDTLIGDRGTLLSGGERQRLALARALLRRPRLLVLDEATSALDPESERSIRHTIEALAPAVTVLTITHRLTSARHADHVIVLEDGRVAAAGSWDDLMGHADSRLASLWAAQLGLEQERVPERAAQSS